MWLFRIQFVPLPAFLPGLSGLVNESNYSTTCPSDVARFFADETRYSESGLLGHFCEAIRKAKESTGLFGVHCLDVAAQLIFAVLICSLYFAELMFRNDALCSSFISFLSMKIMKSDRIHA